jgi:hypothetical protein
MATGVARWTCSTWDAGLSGWGNACFGLSWSTYRDHSYLTIRGNASWAELRDYCARQNSHLVVVDDSAENAWIAASVAERWLWTWIGLSATAGSTWSWIGSAQPTYRNWGSGRPTYSSPGYCAVLGRDGAWQDVSCTWDMGTSICERP